jgi:hypothetical protein
MRRSLRALITSIGAVVLLGTIAPSPITGEFASARADEASLIKDLKTGSDFRVRVTAALSLGRSKSKAAVTALIGALSDSSAAVRAASAAALASLGDGSAVPALKRARGTEKDGDVKSALDDAISKLSAKSRARFLVSIGKLQNKSSTSSAAIDRAFKRAAVDRLSSVPGVELVTDSSDVAAEAKRRGLPGVMLDGNLTKLTKSTAGSDVGYAAHVEFIVRKVPEQSLKASVTGDAKALAAAAACGEKELSQLQIDAVTAATESALKGAPSAIEAAAK